MLQATSSTRGSRRSGVREAVSAAIAGAGPVRPIWLTSSLLLMLNYWSTSCPLTSFRSAKNPGMPKTSTAKTAPAATHGLSRIAATSARASKPAMGIANLAVSTYLLRCTVPPSAERRISSGPESCGRSSSGRGNDPHRYSYPIQPHPRYSDP